MTSWGHLQTPAYRLWLFLWVSELLLFNRYWLLWLLCQQAFNRGPELLAYSSVWRRCTHAITLILAGCSGWCLSLSQFSSVRTLFRYCIWVGSDCFLAIALPVYFIAGIPGFLVCSLSCLAAVSPIWSVACLCPSGLQQDSPQGNDSGLPVYAGLTFSSRNSLLRWFNAAKWRLAPTFPTFAMFFLSVSENCWHGG